MHRFEDMNREDAVARIDEWVLSPDGRFRACFTDVGEGVCGEYDPDDPDDTPLLRLDVQSNDPAAVRCDDPVSFEACDPDAAWFWVANGSYCTNVNADTVTEGQLARLLCRVLLEVDGQDGSLKRPLEEMSWLTATSAD